MIIYTTLTNLCEVIVVFIKVLPSKISIRVFLLYSKYVFSNTIYTIVYVHNYDPWNRYFTSMEKTLSQLAFNSILRKSH